MFRKFLIRLSQWEYWPFSVLYFPVYFQYFWLSLKNRSLFFFTASNPQIAFGGMFGERKSDIFKIIPSTYLPSHYRVARGDLSTARKAMNSLSYPVVAKPDIGERGRWVEKIQDDQALENYVRNCPADFLLQEWIDLPVELGVFYVRMPNEYMGKVTSVVRKSFLKVVGDGTSTINELLQKNERALLTANLQSNFLQENGNQVLASGEQLEIEPIGNHCRGTMFLNDNSEIDKALEQAIDKLSKQIPDFYFGRFDLKCKSYEDLKQLKNFKILELNGAGAEPGHIYQPGFSLLKAYGSIFWHLSRLAEISRQNRKNGFSYWRFDKGIRWWRSYQKYQRKLMR